MKRGRARGGRFHSRELTLSNKRTCLLEITTDIYKSIYVDIHKHKCVYVCVQSTGPWVIEHIPPHSLPYLLFEGNQFKYTYCVRVMLVVFVFILKRATMFMSKLRNKHSIRRSSKDRMRQALGAERHIKHTKYTMCIAGRPTPTRPGASRETPPRHRRPRSPDPREVNFSPN